jgi:glycogen synthase
LAMRDGFAAANVVVAPSRFMQLALRRHYAVLQSRLIPNGRDAERFPPRLKEEMVFAAGRLWDRAKNVAALEQAASSLPWPIHVAGDTRHPGREEAFTARRLNFLGPLSSGAMAEWFGRAAIYAHPARYEPFGLAALEAALGGCALVLGDVASLRELWDGVAVFVDPDDTDALQAALEALVADAQLRQMLAMRARRRALALTPRRMAAAYMDAYAEATARATCVS